MSFSFVFRYLELEGRDVAAAVGVVVSPDLHKRDDRNIQRLKPADVRRELPSCLNLLLDFVSLVGRRPNISASSKTVLSDVKIIIISILFHRDSSTFGPSPS